MPSPLQRAIEQVARRSAWFPIAVFFAHIVLSSEGFSLYALWPPFDIVMHVLGGVAIAYFFDGCRRAAERHGLIAPLDLAVRLVLILALTGTATVVWEFAEFLSDRYLGTTAQGGLNDTLLDMLMGLVGGIGYVTATRARGRRVATGS